MAGIQHSTPDDFSQPSQARDDFTVKLLVHLFDRFCTQESVEEDQRSHINPVYFFDWLRRHLPLFPPHEEVCEEAGVPASIWDYLLDLVHAPAGLLQVLPVWPRITLSRRPPPTHELESMHLICLLKWKDGAICPLSINTPALLAQPQGLSDALCASLISQQWKAILDIILNLGLDGLHDHQADHLGGQEPFNALLAAIHRSVQTLPPVQQGYALKYVRLFQTLIAPPIPPHLLQKAQQVIAREVQEEQSSPRGGWND